MRSVLSAMMLLSGLLSRVQGESPVRNLMVIQIPLDGKEQRCFADTVKTIVDKTRYTFKAMTGSGLSTEKLQVEITLEDNVVKEAAITTEEVDYTLDAEGDFGGRYGDHYQLCFKNNQKKDAKAKIELKQEILSSPGADHQAPESDLLKPVEQLIVDAQSVAHSLTQEFLEDSKLEQRRLQEDKRLRSKIGMMSLFTIVVLLSVAARQLVLLNRFFRSKKLI